MKWLLATLGSLTSIAAILYEKEVYALVAIFCILHAIFYHLVRKD